MKPYATTAGLLSLATACLVGCAHPDVLPEPLPEATATYRRTWAYLDQGLPARRDSTYQPVSLAPTVSLSPTSLVVELRTKPRQEGILLHIDRSRLSPTVTGSYTYLTRLNTTADVYLNYSVFFSQTSAGGSNWNYGTLSSNQLTGTLTITAYDAARQLLSGEFSALVPDASDPAATDATPTPRRCAITLSGSFANLPITPRQ